MSAAEINGGTGGNWANQLATRIAAGSATIADSDTWSTSAGSLAASRGGGVPITASHDVVSLRSLYTGGAAVADANRWAEYYNIVVRAILKTKAGADITSGYSTDTVLASEVVADVVGRLCPLFDGANATITASSYAIEQLAYLDPVNARAIFDDLLKLESSYRWGAYESNIATGKHRFEFVPWATTVRYEAGIDDGYDSDGSAEGLFNEAVVRYKAVSGQTLTVTRTSSVPDLTAAGLTRTIDVDLGDEVASLTNAQRVGDQILAQHQYPPNAGRLTVARRIIDNYTGRMVDPWEIKAGELIRLRGVRPNIDALNATDRDGVAVMRIQSREVDAGRGAIAELELDSYSRSATRSLVDAATIRQRRR